MTTLYDPTVWQAGVTPVSSTNLNKIEQGIRGVMPVGTVISSFQDDPEPGFLKLDGAELSRTTFEALFDYVTAKSLIGSGKPFGVGDGSTTFVLPDARQRFLTMPASGIGGETGGADTHTHTNPATGSAGSHAHTNPNTGSVGNHSHSNPNTGSSGAHTHPIDVFTGLGGSHDHTTGGGPSSVATFSGSTHSYSSGGHTHSVSAGGSHDHAISADTDSGGAHTHTIGNTGSTGSHSHSMGDTSSSGSHTHSQAATASSDSRPAFIEINYFIAV